MRTLTQPLAVPLRQTPIAFRALAAMGAAVTAAGLGLVLQQASGPSPAQLIRQPGFVLLAALVLLADLYPLLPAMRDVRTNVTFAWSTALSLAAVLAYGPTASVLFLVTGVTAALARRHSRWWPTVLNVMVFTIIGVVLAGLSKFFATFDPLMPPGAWRLTVWGLAMALVVLALYTGLVGLALTSLGVASWRRLRDRYGKSVRIWAVSLIAAPLLAALAIEGPWALPCMAVVIVALNHISRTMFRSTAAARTDGLTGLANRSTLTRELARRIAGPDGGNSVWLMLIDLNRFKDVNDTYGHLVGDEVLTVVAHRLRVAADPADLVARYGGDEFAIVSAPGTTATQAAAAAAAIRKALGEPVRVGGVEVVVGGAIGIAQADDHGADVLALLERADRQMYRAKRKEVGGPADPARPDEEPAEPGGRDAGRSAGPTPAIAPVWSMAVQGSSTSPAPGWPGVAWSASPWSGAPDPPRSVVVRGGL